MRTNNPTEGGNLTSTDTMVEGEWEKNLFGMRTNNPTEGGNLTSTDTKVELIFQRVFCNYL